MSQAYLDRLTKHPHTQRWKLVKTNEQWYPNWEGDTFLVLLKTTLATANKPKRSRTYYVYCCGLDDFEMARRDMKWSEAKELFEAITDGITQAELQKLGVERE